MKKILFMSAITAVIATGCATDKAYEITKVGYVGVKAAVKELPLEDETVNKLQKVDKIAITYDSVRNAVRDQIDDSKKKEVVDTSVVSDN